ncbi:unnamed protein product [Microthlaspi erraticum]|uniref:Reverse transcriptase domain-containing protein n=1 Tax=Microthlaspi erraticum TaxID=1685480 RepID=A0A6D2KIB5_9BRAS|nr:unnamed protein product [Microthlaspi erraticum]
MKRITGLKVARASPAVSHLLFADDSLFFCRATGEESRVLLQILKEYEVASGQQINLGKSSVQFGHTVDPDVRREVHQTLGITTVGGCRELPGDSGKFSGHKDKNIQLPGGETKSTHKWLELKVVIKRRKRGSYQLSSLGDAYTCYVMFSST